MLGIAVKLTVQFFRNFFPEFFFSGHHVFSEHLVPQLLIVIMRRKAFDLLHLKLEVALQIMNLLVTDAEHFAQIIVPVRNFMRIQCERIAHFCPGK